jgi:hypothetical protein
VKVWTGSSGSRQDPEAGCGERGSGPSAFSKDWELLEKTNGHWLLRNDFAPCSWVFRLRYIQTWCQGKTLQYSGYGKSISEISKKLCPLFFSKK